MGVSPSSDSPTVDQSSFFPYLPGMVPFGLLNAVGGPARARATPVSRSPVSPSSSVRSPCWRATRPSAAGGRALQFLVILPSGALPMVTGGDDLPVLALMLLGLVLAASEDVPCSPGSRSAVPATLKFTAWPLLRAARCSPCGTARAGGRPCATAWRCSSIVVPVIGAGVVLDPTAFFDERRALPARVSPR